MTANTEEGMNIMNTQTSLGDSKAIISNQEGIHEKLDEVVKRHLTCLLYTSDAADE